MKRNIDGLIQEYDKMCNSGKITSAQDFSASALKDISEKAVKDGGGVTLNAIFYAVLYGLKAGYIAGYRHGNRAAQKEAGKILKELRGKRSMSSTAELLGISTAALAAYENGERMPRDEVKIRLAALYNQSIESIFGG